MALLDRCKEFGWHLSEEGIKQIVENGTSQDVKSIIKKALDIDLRDISTPSFPEDIAKGKYDNIPGHIVVQVQKIRNVSAPKANEESQGAPRMLKLSLTDGHANCQAVEIEQIASLSLNTPPGTKIFLKTETVSMAHGYLLIGPEHVQVLGGKVAVLVEKWELNRSLAKHVRGRGGEEGGPPPWIPFGQKILRANPQDRHFKSLESKDKENRGDSEFDAQRKDAIAEASRAGAKKVFGGGHKPLLDHNVQQIVDYGFTVEQAEYALKQSRNNVEKALKNLQRSENRRGGGNNNHVADGRNETKKGDDTAPPVTTTSSSTSRRKGRDRNDDDLGQQKPSGRLSLFDFLEDKLPASIHTEKPEKSSNSFEQRRGGPRGGGRGSRTTTSGGGSGRTGGTGGGGSRGKGSRSNNNNNHQSGGSVGVWSSDSPANVPISSSNKHQMATSGSNNSSSLNNHFHYNQHHPAHRGEDSNKGQRYSTLSNINPSGQQKPPRFQNQQHQQYKSTQQQQHQTHHQQQSLSGFYNDSSSTGTSSCNNTWSAFNNTALDNLTSNWPARYGSSSSPSAGPTTTTSNSNNDMSSSNRIRATQQATSRSSLSSSSSNSAFGNNFIDSRVFNNHQDAIGQQPKVSKSAIGQGYARTSNNTQHQHLLSDFANYNNKDSSTSNAFRGSLYQGVVQQTENINTNNNSSAHYLRFPGTGTNSQEANNCPSLKQWVWSKGDKCMAKYWEDDRYYHAEVTGVSQRTCVVRFLDYGNFEEVLQDDCIPFSEGS